MSSFNLENTPRSPADRILTALKTQGALSSAALGKQLGITGEAVRQQLLRLAEQELVVAASEVKGVGRPLQVWRLTAAAQARFPDTHASLTAQLLGIVRAHMGQAALDTIVGAREAETRAAYQEALADKTELPAKVATLTGLRSEEGYMADWSQETDGSFLLVENNCPIHAAATACAGFCRAELDVFLAVLGPSVSVERGEHIVSGDRRCAYVIRTSEPVRYQAPGLSAGGAGRETT